MATKEQLEKALRNAHSAGDTAAAQRFASEIKKLDTAPSKAQTDFDSLPTWQKPLQALDDLLRSGSDAITLGATDYLRTLVGTQPDLETARQATKDADERSGFAGTAVRAGSSLPLFMALPQLAIPAKAGPVLQAAGNTGLAALEGAAFGGADALGHGEDVIEGQIGGGLFGAGGRMVSGILGKGLDMFMDRGTASARMSPRDLRLAEDRAYNAMEDEGIGYRPAYVDELVNRLHRDTRDAWPGVNDGTIGARDRADTNLRSGGRGFNRVRTMSQIDKERQNIASDVSGSPDPRDHRFGSRMKKTIDDWMDDARPNNVTAGNGDPEYALDRLFAGRELHQRGEKLDLIDEKLGRAERQAARNLSSGEDATIKQQVGGILDDPKKRDQYTPDEQEQMRIVNDGTTGQKILRQAGRMAPGGGLGYYASAAAGGLGLMMGPPGLALAAVPPVVGALAKKLSERATRKEADKLYDMVSSGRSLKKIPGMSSKTQRELARMLTLLGIQSGDPEYVDNEEIDSWE